MEIGGFDSEIIQDFLTESGELLEQLEGDLVSLEQACDDLDLINTIFRALHTIKGSASFLALTPLVAIAHASETALNAARSGQLVITPDVMDDLLAATDTLRKQFEELNSGTTSLTEADPTLVQRLTDLGSGKVATKSELAAAASPDGAQTTDNGITIEPLNLPDNKEALLEFLIIDVQTSLELLREAATKLRGDDTTVFGEIVAVASELSKAVDFFDFEDMAALAKAIEDAGEHGAGALAGALEQFCPRLEAALHILDDQAQALGKGERHIWKVDLLCERIHTLVDGDALTDDALLPAGASVDNVLSTDGVLGDAPSTPESSEPIEAPNQDAPAEAVPQPADGQPPATPPKTATPKADSKPDAKEGASKPVVEQSVRVEVGRLETLMNLVGELVLQKNRIGALSRQADDVFNQSDNQELGEHMMGASAALDRVAGDIQVAVMRTRMQPLDKLFGKYPRLIRDLAAKTGKKIKLVVEGGDTEVDKSVIEELGDPLVHILRNSADHGVEMPDVRAAAGKPEEGIIRLCASHEGSFVQVIIEDNGKGLDREVIGAKAIERGLTTEAELANKTNSEVFRYIFEAGFSTAAQVSDLSGRGVGMDVVRTNIEKLKGTITIDSEKGKGTTLTIAIPLTIAIMQAMMVRVGQERYAVPLSNIVEIVRPTPDQLTTIREHPVMRLRNDVLPLIQANTIFDVPQDRREEAPFAVVLQSGSRRLGLMVSELIGQREIVVKPLGEMHDAPSAVSGATVREDGGVSLIVDVIELFRIAKGRGF
ncbi:MAG: chemotaxis protein CheW [Phycisphaerales bacterium JB064]